MSNLRFTQLKIGYLRADISSWYDLPSDHPSFGLIMDLPMFAYHLALRNRSVIVDAPSNTFPDDYSNMIVPGSVIPTLLDQLESAGIDAEKISDVIITHAHFDHYNGLTQERFGEFSPIFPNARHFLGVADWLPESFEDLEENTLRVVHELGLLTLVEEESEIGAGLTIIPAPGESAGHQILHVENSSSEAFFAGDLYHHPLEFSENALNVHWAAVEDIKKSKMNLIQRAANSNAAIYFSHIEGPFRVEMNAGELNWQSSRPNSRSEVRIQN